MVGGAVAIVVQASRLHAVGLAAAGSAGETPAPPQAVNEMAHDGGPAVSAAHPQEARIGRCGRDARTTMAVLLRVVMVERRTRPHALADHSCAGETPAPPWWCRSWLSEWGRRLARKGRISASRCPATQVALCCNPCNDDSRSG
jgi:hypothetical protein